MPKVPPWRWNVWGPWPPEDSASSDDQIRSRPLSAFVHWLDFSEKKGWDWLNFLAQSTSPIVVGFGVLFLTQRDETRQRENSKYQRDFDVITEYMKEVKSLLLDKDHNALTPDPTQRRLIRNHTLSALKQIHDPGNRTLIARFLLCGSDVEPITIVPPISWSSAKLNKTDLKGCRLQKTDLSWSYLKGADLRGAILERANLAYADLAEADLRGSDLSRSILRHAVLSSADIRGAKMGDSNLFHANIAGSFLSHADLKYADLSMADLRGSDLQYANLQSANLGSTGRPPVPRNERGANLSGALLRGANLMKADLKDAYLGVGKIEESGKIQNLKGTDLTGADLRGADLRGADLTGADLRGADLRVADLRGAVLRGSDLRDADLRGANLDDVESDSATQWPPSSRMKWAKNVSPNL